MSTSSTASSAASPFAFWKAEEFIHRALDQVYDAADQEIDEVIAALAIDDPATSINDWSIRISAEGLQIIASPIDDWVQSVDLTGPSYLHNFGTGDSYGWLRSLIDDHRDALKGMLVEYLLRTAGYAREASHNTFADALERKQRIVKEPAPIDNDDILW